MLKPTDDEAIDALADRLAAALRRRGWRLACAESCTGGWLAKVLTDRAGSSDWFEGGVVAYGNGAKQGLLDVPAQVLDRDGAVSEACARALALGARRRFGSDLSVAITGIAGPGGGSADKPVGTVWFAWAGPGDAVDARCHSFAGDRAAVRRQAVAFALAGLEERA